MRLTPAMEKYILHWGEMGTRWGVNRSVSQVHALLYLAARPLSAEEIADTLGLARSNVSTSLKELLAWTLITRRHLLGDRRDHFEAKTELWEVLTAIVENRKAREIDPTLTLLRQCVVESDEELAGGNHTPAEVRERIAKMLVFMEELSAWYEQISRLPKPVQVKLMQMGGTVAKLIPTG